ncbi:oxidoreductase [Herbaspirillum seropedicae]|uniref:oxidoreductase n=1 Tax=Herbaspirillum seropedicae TaxID=964 RepID=UPI003D994EFC
MTPLLQAKTIIVVGAAGRIGRVIVNAILSAGGHVVALDNDTSGLHLLSEAHHTDALECSSVDMTDRASLDRALSNTHERYGAVDGAVNTAYPRNQRYGRQFFDVEYADFCENTSLHMGGYFLFMQACARYALERRQAFSLVNLSSIYGSMAPRFGVYADTAMTMPVEYAAIKAGLEHMTRYVTAYMKGRNTAFRANCVSPGGIQAGQDERFLKRYGSHCLSKGMLDADDITGAVLFLLSDNARHISGQNLIVDDGFSV